ncbi:SUKH-4 family immunity protein [Micromonospora yasonensis]|uniref:SUKH-4 family immunity protein n=1 Tax=Micromonospora yasonensis TaxID=1128667 RepID=UPI0022329D4E|nr:SUKH-4 family immunity protein [Micromonospora yasonensis]MCW3839720.1 SUKH-4 family immunity protein [Micromonospora yasonensis]
MGALQSMPEVVRYSESGLRRIFGENVPLGAAELLGVELPRGVDVFFEAYPAERVGLSTEFPGRLAVGRAWHGVCEVHIDLSDGSLWSVVAAEGGSAEVTFMNSDIKRFVIFLRRVHDLALLAEMEEGPRYHERAEAVSRELAQVDESATRAGAWWAGIIEEMVAMV